MNINDFNSFKTVSSEIVPFYRKVKIKLLQDIIRLSARKELDDRNHIFGFKDIFNLREFEVLNVTDIKFEDNMVTFVRPELHHVTLRNDDFECLKEYIQTTLAQHSDSKFNVIIENNKIEFKLKERIQ